MKHAKSKTRPEIYSGPAADALYDMIHAMRGRHDTLIMALHRFGRDKPTSLISPADGIKIERAMDVISAVLAPRQPKKVFSRREIDDLEALPGLLPEGWAHTGEARAMLANYIGSALENIVPFHEGKFRAVLDAFWDKHGERITEWTEETPPEDVPPLLRPSRRFIVEYMNEYKRSGKLSWLFEGGPLTRPPIAEFEQALISAESHFAYLKEKDPMDIGLLADHFDADQALKGYERLLKPLVQAGLTHWSSKPCRGTP